MTTLAEMAADLKDVSWQDARTFTTVCRKHGRPCRAKAHQFTRNIYLSCDSERTLTEAEFTGQPAQQGGEANGSPEIQRGLDVASPAVRATDGGRFEDATAPASGERLAGAATTATSSQPEEDSRVAPPKGGVKRGTVPKPERDGSNAVANGAIPAVNPVRPGGLVPSGASQQRGTVRQVPYASNGRHGQAPAPARYAAADDILKRVPPQNLEAEQAIFGSIIIDNETLNVALKIISAESFYREAHRELFKAMVALHGRRVPIEVVTLGQELRTRDVFEAIGGNGYIAEVAASVPTARNMEHYANIVRDMAIKRQIATQATMLASLAYDGVTVPALVGEMERLLKPIAASTGPELPQLINRDIEIVSGLEFWRRHQEIGARQWLVDGFLARKEISLWSGKVEAGKTTLMRTLCMCIARGDFFLERHTYPSRVLYVMLDADGEAATYEAFLQLGWNPHEDPIDFLVDPVMALRPRSFEQFHAKLLEYKPAFVVIDPLGRFQKITDFLGYETTYAMAQFSELAKQTNTHIGLLHHIPRGRHDSDDPATAGFGSIAIAGGCNARFVCIHKAGDIYTLVTSKGKGGGFQPFDGEQVLTKDSITGWVTLAGAYSYKDQARAIKPQALDVIANSDREWSSDALGRELKVQRSAAGLAALMLYEDGKVNHRKDGKRYVFWAKDKEGSSGLLV